VFIIYFSLLGVCAKTPISFPIFGTGCYACQKNTHPDCAFCWFLFKNLTKATSGLRFFWLCKPRAWTFLIRHMSFRASTTYTGFAEKSESCEMQNDEMKMY